MLNPSYSHIHSHHSGGGHDGESWEQQLQAAEEQYSNFFPDLDLSVPAPQSAAPPSSASSRAPIDPATLFHEDSFMAAVLALGIAALDPRELAPSGQEQHQLDASRRYSKATLGHMELLDELDAVFMDLVTNISR
jgi:hypothetical protein